MKNIVYKLLVALAVISLNSCDDNEAPIFIAEPSAEGVAFTNTFASEYLLSEATEDNIADRFIWEEADFGTETNITYELQGATDPTFATFEQVGSTNETNLPILVSQLLGFAKELGLDDDPTTTQPDSDLPNNTGQIYFRLHAYLGTGASNTVEMFSDIQSININWIENTTESDACPSIFAVGEALTDIGWNFSSNGEIPCENDILQRKFRFTNATNFRFFEESGVWTSGLGFNYYTNEGYTIDANLESADDDDDNFLFAGESGIYTVTIDNTEKTIDVVASGSLYVVGGATPGGWDFAGGETELVETSPDIWEATLALTNDKFRFFETLGDWSSGLSYSYYDNEDFTIDANLESEGEGDFNFIFSGTPGTYTLTINAIEKTITLN